MRLFPVPRTKLYVELLLRGEHPPPHLHVDDDEVPWAGRFEFSYVSDAVRVMDIVPIEDAPSQRMLDRIRTAIGANLTKCREEWWNRIGTCGLDDRWIQFEVGKLVLLPGQEKGAIQIKTARYDPATREVEFRMWNGSRHTMVAGEGIER